MYIGVLFLLFYDYYRVRHPTINVRHELQLWSLININIPGKKKKTAIKKRNRSQTETYAQSLTLSSLQKSLSTHLSTDRDNLLTADSILFLFSFHFF